MAGAHAAGARVGMDQLLRALGRLVQRRELGPQKLEVAHRFPLQDFPATTLLRANMTEPALGLQARGRTLPRAQSATDEVGHLRKRKFGLTPQQGQYLVGRSDEHTSELQSLRRPPYAVFCLKQNK